jgi:exodeoxyribonuclease VII large subunit
LLQQQFEQLKRKLEAEGLFDAERKKPLPSFPANIALITSPSGAAIRDMLHVLKRRWPIARIRLYPVAVQGEEAPPAIVRAIRAAGAHAWADVILLGRGGGSLEDLWAFNDERVARAVAECPLPLISAVGHETDFSIADFVADLRAPTPSAAAELATPDAKQLSEQFKRLGRQLKVRIADQTNTATQKLDHVSHRLHQAHPQRRLLEQRQRLALADHSLRREARRRMEQLSTRLAHLGRQLTMLHPGRRIDSARERLTHAQTVLRREAKNTVGERREAVMRIARTLNAVSPLQTVGRGYALLTATGTSNIVSRTDAVPKDGKITAQVGDGRLFCVVQDSDQQRPEDWISEKD